MEREPGRFRVAAEMISAVCNDVLLDFRRDIGPIEDRCFLNLAVIIANRHILGSVPQLLSRSVQSVTVSLARCPHRVGREGTCSPVPGIAGSRFFFDIVSPCCLGQPLVSFPFRLCGRLVPERNLIHRIDPQWHGATESGKLPNRSTFGGNLEAMYKELAQYFRDDSLRDDNDVEYLSQTRSDVRFIASSFTAIKAA